MTATRARQLLEDHGLATRKSLGQHLLVDPNTVRKIARLAELQADETILEIGPGLGSLTVALAEAVRRVVAVELDSSMAKVLRDVVPEDRVEIVVADAMKADLSALIGGPARLIANLPYNVATPLIARVLDDVPDVSGGLVMVQRELGKRWTASPGSKVYGAISLKIKYHCTAEIVAVVPKTVFLPPPKVESVLVAFTRRDKPAVEVSDPAAFFKFVSGTFGQRRKTIHNSLGAVGYDRDEALAALEASGVDEGLRPEQIDLEGFAALYRAATS